VPETFISNLYLTRVILYRAPARYTLYVE